MNFTKKVALRKNIIMNTYESVALLQCYILASYRAVATGPALARPLFLKAKIKLHFTKSK